MSERLTLLAPHLPLWRRLGHWLGTPSPGRVRSAGGDTARMDLGYEAAYAPGRSEPSGPPSRLDDEHAGA